MIIFMVLLVFPACSPYYHGTGARKYIFSQPDTMVYTWVSRNDSLIDTSTVMIYRHGDTVFSITYAFDSTLAIYRNYLIKPEGLELFQYFHLTNNLIMFYQIKQGMEFSFDSRHVGKKREKSVFNWPERKLYLAEMTKSIGSQLDTITLGDSILPVLRVDLKYHFVNKDRNSRESNADLPGKMSYYIYPGLGVIYMTESPGYVEEVIKIQKYQNQEP